MLSTFSNLTAPNFVILFYQGAGEPMEISEQVGMTPEIIQKVLFLFFVLHKSFFSDELSVFCSL